MEHTFNEVLLKEICDEVFIYNLDDLSNMLKKKGRMRISVCRSCHLVKKWGNMYSCMCIFFLHRKYLGVCKKLMILVASEE